MQPPSERQRPLSPHLQIYKIQITSLLSILHRGTGIILFLGSFVWALWFMALAAGQESYEALQSLLFHPLGVIALFGWSLSFFYHLLNGIRHLTWDLGHGYDMRSVRLTGWAVVFATFLFTFIAWGMALAFIGIGA